MELEKIIWNEEKYSEFLIYLRNRQDKVWDIEKHSRILNLSSDKVIGIKTPILKEVAKKIAKGDYKGFLNLQPNDIYEEKVIRGLVISYLKKVDYIEIEKYLYDFYKTYVDSWAVCDVVVGSLKIINKHREEYFDFIKEWHLSSNPWLIRVQLVSFIGYYFDDEYIDRVLDICKDVKSDEYYVKMGLAWLLSILFIKQREKTYKFLIDNRDSFDTWTYNKTIQKIRESLRVSQEDKESIKNLKKRD